MKKNSREKSTKSLKEERQLLRSEISTRKPMRSFSKCRLRLPSRKRKRTRELRSTPRREKLWTILSAKKRLRDLKINKKLDKP